MFQISNRPEKILQPNLLGIAWSHIEKKVSTACWIYFNKDVFWFYACSGVILYVTSRSFKLGLISQVNYFSIECRCNLACWYFHRAVEKFAPPHSQMQNWNQSRISKRNFSRSTKQLSCVNLQTLSSLTGFSVITFKLKLFDWPLRVLCFWIHDPQLRSSFPAINSEVVMSFVSL